MIELTRLQKEVIKQLGYEELDKDAAEQLDAVMRCSAGAAGGFSGFIYYSETCKFYFDNKKFIIDQLQEDRDNLGESSIASMVSNFGCLKDVPLNEIELALMGFDTEYETTIQNALAWYALENTAYQLEEDINNLLNEDN